MTQPAIPRFADLLAREGAPPGAAWGVFGDDDTLGCLNLLTPERVVAAARTVRKGRVFPLDLPLDQPDPPLFGRQPLRHTIIDMGGGMACDDYLDNFYPQASSQWDALRHIRHPQHGFYNGCPDAEAPARLGIDHFARRGIVARGVLLDADRYLRQKGAPLDPKGSAVITPETLDECSRAQGVQLLPGDALIVRTGWLAWYLNEAAREDREQLTDLGKLKTPGLGPVQEMAEFLWDHQVAAVAADNPALEPWPVNVGASGGFLSLHLVLLPLLGMPIGELWYLDDLAADCAADGVYEFLLASAPLHVRQGSGSTANALAVK